MSNPLRILAIIEASTITGPAKNLLDFCRTVHRDGKLQISVAVFDRARSSNDFTNAVENAGIRLSRIDERYAGDYHTIARLRRLIHDVNPDIVETHAVKSHFLLYLTGAWRRWPWISFHHGYTFPDLKMRIYNHLDRISLRAATRVVTVSKAFRSELLDRGVSESRIELLPNAVDDQWARRVATLDRASIRAQLNINAAEKVLLAVGRLSREKGHIDLINAYRRLRQLGMAVRLVLVGDGPLRRDLEASAGPEALFSGHVRDAAPYFAAADIMVLPSHSEGSSNVLLEAMSIGLPVIATNVGGIPEIVTDDPGAVVVPPRDQLAMTFAIVRILEDYSERKRLMTRGRTIIAAKHTLEVRARLLTSMYQKTMRVSYGQTA